MQIYFKLLCFLWLLFFVPFGTNAAITLQSPYVAKAGVFKGQMHVHSKCAGGCSDGSQPPAAVAAAYRDAGYDFISITDHNLITPDPKIAGILFIGGIEDTKSDGHLNRINATKATVSSLQGVIDLALSEGSFVFLNHPNWPGGYPANPIWTDARIDSVRNYHAIEVWNSLVAPNQNAESRIDRLLSEGKRFYLVANDDCHNVASAYCKTASVKVFSDNLTIADIMANLKSGNFYASSGANISRIEVLNQTIRIKTDAASKIEFIGDQGMVLQSGNGITSADYAVRGNEKYIRARVVRNSDGKMAWTNPIYISGANQAPTGYFDYAKCDNFAGWACDADDYSKTLEVHFYYDGPVGSGKFAGSVTANAAREAAVGNGCGGNAAHGFKMPPPDFLKDGQSHTIYAYAINNSGGVNPLLGKSSFKCSCAPNQVSGCKVCRADGSSWTDDNSKCTSGQVCNAGVCKSSQGCAPKTCATLGNYQCGDWSDGCGKTINCGDCSSSQVCSAGNCVSDCSSRASKRCDGADLYWYNSCNAKEDLAQNCSAENKICRDGVCVSSGGGGGIIEPQKEQPQKMTRAEILVKIQEIKRLLIQLIAQLIAELQKQLAATQ